MSVRRIYVEKKQPYAVEAVQLVEDIRGFLGVKGLARVRILIRYDVENISEDAFRTACCTVFSEPPVDILYHETIEIPQGVRVFSVEPLPGQFDQRADSAQQCIRFIDPELEPTVLTAKTYLLEGTISEEEFDRIKGYCINPVDSRETGLDKPDTLELQHPVPDNVAVLDGFISMEETAFRALYDSLGLAMTYADFQFIRSYFDGSFDGKVHRDPTITEIRVLDTYWSDHCRHTTFLTECREVQFDDGYYSAPMELSYRSYRDTFDELYQGRKDKYVCLMDIALMGMKKLKADGKLTDMEESEENNACTVVVPVEVDYGDGPRSEEWLVFFKNETHNHPTEIEPFGGAATCLGGAIRDPLSGRGYVYQAMRVTGAADPTVPVSETLKGKLPQKKLVRGAAAGYSSYGNQIGLATGHVREIYHPGYMAKRMEIGAVMGAAARRSVQRLSPAPGDIVILLGGRTGRDGIGGATGSSKAHTTKSLSTCGAEVQKGNAPTERKLQRLFRRPEAAHLIKKCNDFGAGGVSVAIGELAAGLRVDLDLVPKKYAGLDGTELAISESQERMAVVVAPEDRERFMALAAEENLEATALAVVTKEPYLTLLWRGDEVVSISRRFLDTNGAHQECSVEVESPSETHNYLERIACAAVAEKIDADEDDFEGAFLAQLADLNTCSQKGLVEMFDSSIGAGTVSMPFGGKYQLTQTQTMIAKLPVLGGMTDTVTMMSYGFDPYLSSWSPYHGAIYAVTESLAKIVASGGETSRVHFTFQEYFRRMSEDPKRWGQPFAALLGAYDAQIGYGLASIGGKDSMSGSFNDIDVPPTLVSFAVDVARLDDVITNEIKDEGNVLVEFRINRDDYDIPVYADVLVLYQRITELMREGQILSAQAEGCSGIAAAAAQTAFGNHYGIRFDGKLDLEELFANGIGNILAEMTPEDADRLESLDWECGAFRVIGTTTGRSERSGAVFSWADREVTLEEAVAAWQGTLEKVFPTAADADRREVESPLYDAADAPNAEEGNKYNGVVLCSHKLAQPTVFIPVFPGTNCEYDSAAAFERAGAKTVTCVFANRDAEDIRRSVELFRKGIEQAQIVMFPGGFSAGDEPDGSAKFFATAFRDAAIREAVDGLLNGRDGLALGICNGFQALIKLGLVPGGQITDGQSESSPTLTFNTIGRHISREQYLRVVSNKSPWLQEADLGGVYVNPASHGEGRFVAPEETIRALFANGQIATQYCDPQGDVSMDAEWNPNGSYFAVEGITSPDGRVLGKMCHSERRGEGVAVNIVGRQDMKIFESGVQYFL
ncbi:phosphoribosylformylglycinamidine synthase [Lachnoclostridium sp. Marseille-P6806]|uniref:phosphoribosylformylglycinamidine synthase n=1 Tax=Lachnoclostridium sp. Marseille-P6806 TaxID=2364793 RepID=UPI0010307AD8|nr:phosphoribosylformylglycinamidine synthase [Lachnoclostridium sp. Marseille-P6806]